MLPFWTSYLIRTYAWMIILRDNGVANSLLQAVGLTSEPLILLNTDFSVILGMTYGFLPFAILPLYVSIDRLDPALVAAARDLYASGRDAFLKVTLPLTMPGIVAATILTFIPAIGDFVTPDLLGGAETTTIAKVVQEHKYWGYKILGFVSDGHRLPNGWARYRVFGTVPDLRRLMEDGEFPEPVDEIVLAVTRKKLDEMKQMFILCEELGIRARVAMNFFQNRLARIEVEELEGIPFLTFTTTPELIEPGMVSAAVTPIENPDSPPSSTVISRTKKMLAAAASLARPESVGTCRSGDPAEVSDGTDRRSEAPVTL
jgi:hypothetical protein